MTVRFHLSRQVNANVSICKHICNMWSFPKLFPLFCISQDMVTLPLSLMEERLSVSFTLWLAFPLHFSSSRLWCKGSWFSAHGDPLCTYTHAGVCPNPWWRSFTQPCWQLWRSPVSSSSLLLSSLSWKRTGTFWNPFTSVSFHSPPSAWVTMCLERPLTRSSESSTNWESLVRGPLFIYLYIYYLIGLCN